jgi:hypothetical protein
MGSSLPAERLGRRGEKVWGYKTVMFIVLKKMLPLVNSETVLF